MWIIKEIASIILCGIGLVISCAGFVVKGAGELTIKAGEWALKKSNDLEEVEPRID